GFSWLGTAGLKHAVDGGEEFSLAGNFQVDDGNKNGQGGKMHILQVPRIFFSCHQPFCADTFRSLIDSLHVFECIAVMVGKKHVASGHYAPALQVAHEGFWIADATKSKEGAAAKIGDGLQ